MTCLKLRMVNVRVGWGVCKRGARIVVTFGVVSKTKTSAHWRDLVTGATENKQTNKQTGGSRLAQTTIDRLVQKRRTTL